MGMRKRTADRVWAELPRRSVVIRLVVLVVVSAVVAGAVAIGTAWCVYSIGMARSSRGQWDELGNAILGFLAGLAAFAWLYIAAISIGVRWVVRPGRRLFTVVVILACTVGAPALIGWPIDVSTHARMPVLGALGAAWAAVLTCALIGFAAGIVRGRAMSMVAGLAVGGILVSVIAGAYQGQEVAYAEQISRYERTRAPLALIDGQSLTSAPGGWVYRSVDKGYRYDQVTVTYSGHTPSTGSTPATIDLVMERNPKLAPCESGTAMVSRCSEIGIRRDGRIIWGSPSSGHGRRGDRTAWVDVPGGRWRITSHSTYSPPESQRIDRDAAVALLTSLEGVDAQAFTAATRRADGSA